MRSFFLNEVRKIRVLKTLSWRIIATYTTMFLAYIVTGQLEFVASIGIGDVVLKMMFYYIMKKPGATVYVVFPISIHLK